MSPSRTHARSSAATAALLIAVAAATGISHAAPAASTPLSQPSADAAQTLASLPVKGRAPKTGYSRDAFGPAWKDTDGNGCDTRNDILQRDLVERVMRDGCTVLTGVLYPDPYTGRNITFTRGKSAVDIDHVVALGASWVTGAFQWDTGKRTRFANDPMNLLAVDASANRQKGDGDAATWLPASTAYRCAYVTRQIAVKAAYGLWVTPAEKEAMTRVLTGCPGAPLPPASTPPASTPPASTPPASTPPASTARYRTCADARAAGVTPIRQDTSPSLYQANTHLDRDKDGIACS